VTVETEGKRHELGARGYSYLPEGFSHRVVAKKKSRVAVVEKRYQLARKLCRLGSWFRVKMPFRRTRSMAIFRFAGQVLAARRAAI